MVAALSFFNFASSSALVRFNSSYRAAEDFSSLEYLTSLRKRKREHISLPSSRCAGKQQWRLQQHCSAVSTFIAPGRYGSTLVSRRLRGNLLDLGLIFCLDLTDTCLQLRNLAVPLHLVCRRSPGCCPRRCSGAAGRPTCPGAEWCLRWLPEPESPVTWSVVCLLPGSGCKSKQS
jgi:hypothetical protein|eukprot:COSAG01_NODE_11141_length_1998_cov_1.044234_3_plen_175_part_00